VTTALLDNAEHGRESETRPLPFSVIVKKGSKIRASFTGELHR
jgi:hypothetical protein